MGSGKSLATASIVGAIVTAVLMAVAGFIVAWNRNRAAKLERAVRKLKEDKERAEETRELVKEVQVRGELQADILRAESKILRIEKEMGDVAGRRAKALEKIRNLTSWNDLQG